MSGFHIPMNLQFLSKFACIALVLISVAPTLLVAQHPRREVLTGTEIEAVRETAIFPMERVKLFTRFVEERAAHIRDLTGRPRSPQRAEKLDSVLQDFTALMDELGSNLDVYSDRHSDIRKALKPLTEATPKWLNILRTLAGEPTFDLARKEAIESGEELADQATRLLHEQDEYFATHKEEKGQERQDPAAESNPKP